MYTLNNSISYVLTKIKLRINYEFAIGLFSAIGHPIARYRQIARLKELSIIIVDIASVVLKYNFNKLPMQVRLSCNFSNLYKLIKYVKVIPIIPSVSTGYGFKKIKNAQNIKIKTYSKTAN